MDKERYTELKSGIPASLRMKIDHLKRYLDAGRAAAFVGAGFSKNAEMPDTAEMKDWKALGRDFYTRLYGTIDESKLTFNDPISLASQVEACFGRNELDNLIQQSLPDSATIPSRLHVSFLNLPWHDVFTTNYDTLLERARLDAERPYTPVTNKETLLYSRHPRIVKLHGSFPNIRPFIITEEDYRTYPQKYAEFVNTVRQALIENLFCMIGFSGDDPNFKSWLGWLRDVMGKQIAPVYYITYDSHLHDALRILNARQNIDIINLFDIPGIAGFQEGFDFLFEYLSEEQSTKWTGSLSRQTLKYENARQVRELLNEMRRIRTTYPQWLVLPKEYYGNFSDVDAGGKSLKSVMSVSELSHSERLHFLFEVNWRMQVSMTPIGVDWFLEAITDLDLDTEEEKDIVIDLKLSLLNYFRFTGQEEEYERLRDKLRTHQASMSAMQQRSFFYCQCLMASSRMESEELKKILSNWNVPRTDFVGSLWKAAMLMDALMPNEAVNLLNDANSQLRATLLASQESTGFLISCKIAIERALYIYGKSQSTYKRYDKCDYLSVIDFFKDKLRNPSRRSARSTKHGFNVDDIQTSWHYGPAGYVEGYLYGYRYYMLCEQVGLTTGLPHYKINSKDHQLFLSHLFPYNHYFPFGILMRSCDAKLIIDVLDRRVMAGISVELANQLFDRFLPVGKSYAELDDNYLSSHMFASAIPVLSRLCCKVSEDRAKEMGSLMFKLHDYCDATEVSMFHECLSTVYHSQSVTHLSEFLSLVMEQPIHIIPCGEADYFIPYSWGEKLTITHTAINVIKDGLKSASEIIKSAALQRAYIALQGIVSPSDKKELENAIVSWRNSSSDTEEIRRSFYYVSLRADDTSDPATILKQDVDNLLDIDVREIHSSNIFSKMEWGYNYCSMAKAYLSTIDPSPVILQFCEMVENNYEMLKRKDENDFFGGIRSFATRTVDSFTRLMEVWDLSNIPTEHISRMMKAAVSLYQCGFASLALMTHLLRYSTKEVSEKQVKDYILNRVTADGDYTTCLDVIRSLVILSKRKRSYQAIVNQMIDMCEYSDAESMLFWVYGLYLLVVNDALKESSKQRVNRLLDCYYNKDLDNKPDSNAQYDLRCRIALLAGAVASKWGDSDATSRWRNMDVSKEFNDVRHAYQRGYEGLSI